ncbi:ligand-dependent nuclear receptor-interacting factor 1 isoform X1 [Etheostoma cragini]|uniref:ligand-dependent nuclear receptor-interacting factor 1 isoform X1 n=1 Tax=Etheostoma cragini TaxID=417921 RepID=UPI00155E5651|nr:ligand-dependent nuclear receptor-interacting factor 1 isoform X1 [Etheostoma cragini]
MFPATKNMESVHSGTGVFYQAIPAVGADGKNIMKLIPVQMVNGQFFHSQISKTGQTQQKAVDMNFAPAPVQTVQKAAPSPPAAQQVVRKQVSIINVFPNQVGLDLGSSPNKPPPQRQNGKLIAVVPQMETPAANREKSGGLPGPLPVTVKAPAMPRGRYLQVLPNAQVPTLPAVPAVPAVPTVPASELPPRVKRPIVPSPADPSQSSGSAGVVYTSPPVTTASPQSVSALDTLKFLCNMSNATSCGFPSKGQKPHLKLIPKVSHRPNSPIKWVIEEEDSFTAPGVDPVISSVSPDIVSVVGKTGKRDSPTAAGRSSEFNKTTVPSSQQSLESVSPQKRPGVRIMIPKGSHEVIDLCDDDAHSDSSQTAASVHTSAATHPEEDNVIFVSYIPPRTDSESTRDLRQKTQMVPVKETDKTGTSGSNSGTEQKSPDGTTGTLIRRKPVHSMSVNTVKNAPRVCGSAATSTQNNEGPNISSRRSTATQQSKGVEVNVERKSPANPNNSDSSTEAMDTPNMKSSANPATSWTSSPAPESQQMDDNLLRQMFGIMADVRVCLQRIDGAPVGSGPSFKDLKGPHESYGCAKVKTEQELLEGSAPPSAHTHTEPLKCSHFKLDTRPLPVVKNKREPGDPRDLETEPAFGYVEPIEEDFLGTDEKDNPNAQDAAGRTQTQTCAYLNANTRRMGRTRKRTMCPCCVPGAQDPKWEEPGDWAWATEQTSKKGRRTKAVSKAVKTAGRTSCLKVKDKRGRRTDEGPARDSLSSDSNELKRCDEIRRIKELLKEQEAALEEMRH